MKTALEQVIEVLEGNRNEIPDVRIKSGLANAISVAISYLEIEKQQIINAYCGGCKQGAKYGIKADDYFKETYE